MTSSSARITTWADAKVSVAGWKLFQFCFHDFASINSTKGYFIESPAFCCNGHWWQLRVYPDGGKDTGQGRVSVSLHHLSHDCIKAKFCIGTETYQEGSDDFEFTQTNRSWCSRSSHFLSSDGKSSQLDHSGALKFVVRMALEGEPASAFIPENSALTMLKEMFNDEATADVHFEIGDNGDKTRRGVEKLESSVLFHAHSLILREFAPVLADLCQGDSTTFITNTEPGIFHHVLHYVYGAEVPKEELQSNAKEIIDAADKYAIVNLKMAEVAYVDSIEITIDNAIDNLLFADGKNCALLKEKVINFLVKHPKESAKRISFKDCPENLMNDLLLAVDGRNRNDWNTDLSTLSVSSLRRKLYELGLKVDIDGSRETMIESIKNKTASS